MAKSVNGIIWRGIMVIYCYFRILVWGVEREWCSCELRGRQVRKLGFKEPLQETPSKRALDLIFWRNLLLQSCSTRWEGNISYITWLISSINESRSEFWSKTFLCFVFGKKLEEPLIWWMFRSPIKGVFEYDVKLHLYYIVV